MYPNVLQDARIAEFCRAAYIMWGAVLKYVPGAEEDGFHAGVRALKQKVSKNRAVQK